MHLRSLVRTVSPCPLLLALALLLLLLPGATASAASASKRQLAEWTRLLSSDDPQKRSSAATSLLAVDNDAALSVLMAALDPKQPKNGRISVITAFGVKGDDRAVKQIVAAIGDQDQDVREAASSALQSINSPAAVQALVEAATDDKRPVQSRTQIIGILGDMRAMDAIPTLITLLSDADPGIGKNARAALERITLRSFDTPGGWAAWWKHSSALSRDEMLAELALLQAQKLADLKQRLESLQLLAIHDHPADQALLIGVLGESESVKVKLEAIKNLNPLRGAPVADALIAALGDTDPAVRSAACEALGAQGDIRAIAPLIKALADDMVVVRSGAAKALGALKAKEALAALCDRLNDASPDVAAAAAGALGELADSKALDALIAAVSSDKTAAPVFEAGVNALAKIHDPRTAPTLIKLLDSKNEKARWTAVDALGNLGAQEASNAICAIVAKDPNAQIRKTALAALSKIAALSSLPAMVDALADADQGVADQALRSLLILAGGDASSYDKALDRLLAAKRYALADKVLQNGLEQVGKQGNHLTELAEMRYRMATGLVAAKEWKLARPHLETLVAKSPGEARYIKDLAACLAGQGELDALLQVLAQARKSAPDKADLWWQETVKAVELVAGTNDPGKVVAAVDMLEKESPELGGASPAARLRDLRTQAKAKIPPAAARPPAQ